MTKNVLIPISLITVITLAGSIGCSKDPKDSGLTQGEDEIVEKARVSGTVAGDEAALEGEGELSAATEAQVVSVDEDGLREVHGSGSIEADGSFEIEAEGMTRTFLVELFDAQGSLVGATIGTASSTSDTVVEVGEVGSETTVEAMVWAEVVVDSGFETVSSAEVRARTDRSAAMAAQLWYDANAAGEAMFASIADALIVAHYSRVDAAAEAGVELDAELSSRVLGHVESAETSSELAMGLDAAFEAEGMAAVDRSAMAAHVEASLRAAIEATLDRSESEGAALIEAYQDSSAQVEARAQAEAWGVLAAGEEGGTALAVELHSQLEAAAEACESGGAGIVEVQAWSEALIVSTVDALVENDLDAGLLVELGLESEVDEATVAEALVTLVSGLRSELAAELQAAAEAQVDGSGQLDASATADLQAAVWADTAARIDELAQAAQASTESRAALHLATTAFVVDER